MEKKNTGLKVLVVILTMLVLALGGFIIYKEYFNKDNKISNNGNNNAELNNNKEDSSLKLEYPTLNEYGYVEKKQSYNNKMIDLGDIISSFRNDTTNNGKLLNITIDDIKLNNKSVTFSYVNHPTDCLNDIKGDYTDEYNRVYLNNTLVLTQNNQACYLSSLDRLIVLNNSHLVLTINQQGMNQMLVYNDSFEKLDLGNIKYMSIVEGDNVNKLLFKGYDPNDSKLIINTYSMTIDKGKLLITVDNKGTESLCDIEYADFEPEEVIKYCK